MKLGSTLGPGGVTRSEIDTYADERDMERLRRTIRRELATHPGQEALAREIGISRIVLRRLLDFSIPRPAHAQKIREWAEDRAPVWVPFGAVLLATAVREIRGPERARTRAQLALALGDGFRRAGQTLRPWLEEEVSRRRISPAGDEGLG
jgi:hypothetical protein